MTVVSHGLTFENHEAARAFWADVAKRNRQAKDKAQRLPKCVWCNGPMWLDQQWWGARAHRVCMEQTRRDIDERKP